MNVFYGVEMLFDHLPQCFFFVKNREGQFLAVNEAMAHAFGAASRQDCIGRTDADFLPVDIAEGYRKDDIALLESGLPIVDRVELLTHAGGIVEWIVTTKVPIQNQSGAIVGVAGFARPYAGDASASNMPEELQSAVAHIRRNFRGKLGIGELADITHRSVSAFERLFKKNLLLSPTEFIRRVRIHEACRRLLDSQASLTSIAIECGFSDQSHFNREFKRVMLTTPVRYRSHRH